MNCTTKPEASKTASVHSPIFGWYCSSICGFTGIEGDLMITLLIPANNQKEHNDVFIKKH